MAQTFTTCVFCSSEIGEQTMADDEATYPAVKFAYDFVQPSYTLLVTRVETTVTRIQALMTFAATITLGFPVLGRAVNEDISFVSVAFGSALLFFVVLMAFGIIARDLGELMVTSPAKIYQNSLHLSEW